MRELLLSACCIAAVGLATTASSDPAEACPAFAFESVIEPPLTATERRMVCGDPENLGAANEGWQKVPVAQAKVHLEAFLQSRGYSQVRYEERSGKVHVFPGDKTTIRSVRSEGAPDWLDLSRKRDLIGRELTPQALTGLEQWLYQELQTRGYPCPTVSTRADPKTGEVVAEIRSGPRTRFETIAGPDLAEVSPEVFSRYRAFRPGEMFNGRLLAITTSRTLLDRVVEDTRFEPSCPEMPTLVTQYAVAGPPREYALGAAFDSELWGILHASWRQARVGKLSSVASVDTFLSVKRQEVLLSFEGYFSSSRPRERLNPRFELLHENEMPYRNLSERISLLYRRSWDRSGVGITADLGPELEFVQRYEGPGDDGRFLSLRARARLMSHEFEFFQYSPRSGHSLEFQVSLNSKALGSTSTASRLELRAERLWNVQDFEPPLLIVATRMHASSTWTPEREKAGLRIPGRYLNYLGGMSDLRGFGRMELPVNEVGGLTALSASVELRAPLKSSPSIQPLALLDLGFLGEEPMRLSRPFYYSAGLGVRLQSPIGAVNASLAKGFSSGGEAAKHAPSHWQFYLTLGEFL